MEQIKFQFLSSSNFWVAVILAIGGLFIGFPEGAARDVVAQVFTLIAGGKALHEYFKQKPTTDVEGAVNNSNWWNYIVTIVTAIVPTLPVGIIEQAENVAINIVGNNWQGVIVGVFSIATILYNLYQDRRKEREQVATPTT